MYPCACRDCMELATNQGELCGECEDAECEPYPQSALVRDAVAYAGSAWVYACQKEG